MKKMLFRKLLIGMGLTLLLCLLVYPLLLPTENYFRLVLQLLIPALFVGAVMVAPLYYLSDKFSKEIGLQLKKLRIDSKSTLAQYPELRPLSRQVSSLKMQIDTQMNELTGQQEQLQVLTDNMQEGLLLVSAAGRVLSYNHAALRLLGQPDISGDFFPVNDLSSSEVFRNLVQQALNGIRGTATLNADDTAVQIIANPVVRDNRLTGAALVLLDVTEREKRDALRREFTSNVSHELKTPLTSIYGIADMMESGMVKKKDIPGFARRIRDESSRMIALIEDIIRLSRLDDDSFTEEVLPLDLYDIACNVREQLRAAADAKHITVTLEGTAAPMQGVPVIVEEMLYNLCDNAIKYNEENGSVSMKVTCTEQQTIFTVSDTGIGIPQADKERIFERFYRVDKSHSKQIGGTGLGLSIVKHGAQFHNATIELESQLGSGTTITLFFPRSAEAAAIAESEAKLDPLNVEIPDAEKNDMIQIREEAPLPAEEPVLRPEAEAEEPEITEITAEEAEPAEEIPEDTAENAAGEAAPAAEPEITEVPEAETETIEDEAELFPIAEADEADPEAPAEERLPLDETDQLLNEAAAALDLLASAEETETQLLLSDAEAPDDAEPKPQWNEPEEWDGLDDEPEDTEPEPEDEPEPAPAEPDAEDEPLHHTRRIDVVPIDESTMDIRI